jgi:2-oxoglutarate ferredoxin oxidoreductase subunit beta
MTNKESKADKVLWLENGQPMLFGAEKNKGIHMDGNTPTIVELNGKFSTDDIMVHNESDYVVASMLANFTYQPEFPDPIGVLYSIDAPVYDDMVSKQIAKAIDMRGTGSIQDLLNSGDTWEVK